MNFQEAKAIRDRLDGEVRNAERAIKSIPSVGSGSMGLTPDAVKATPEFQAARQEFFTAFEKLRAFNLGFIRHFKKEIREERRNRTATPTQENCNA